MNSVQYQTPAVPVANFSSPLPQYPLDRTVDHARKAAAAIQRLSSLNESHLMKDAILRDLYALTGTIRNFSGSKSVTATWKELSELHHLYDLAVVPGSSCIVSPVPTVAWVQADFTFKTRKDGFPPTECSGLIRVAPDADASWKIWLISTMLEKIEGVPDVDILHKRTPEQSVKERDENGPESGKDFFSCIIVGAGQAGISTAGRMKAAGVSHVCLEKNDELGGNWLNRYESFRLHTVKEYMHMPFSRNYLKDEPEFLASKDIVRGYARYVDWYGVNIWLSTTVEKADWNEEDSIWTVRMNRHGQKRTISGNHLIFAIGAGGQVPYTPDYPGREKFQGESLHSVVYKNSHAWKGKRGIIVGTANTAHDVAEDMLEAGLSSITMIQRSPTMIFPRSTYRAIMGDLYDENTDIQKQDRDTMATPLSITRPMAIDAVKHLADADPEIFDSLERVGFRTDRYPDPFYFLCERWGGHYFDVGGSAKIAAGLIKTHYGNTTSYTPTGLAFADGSTVDADVIVWCTGFEGNMRLAAMKIVGEEIGNRMENYFQVDREGELIGLCKPMVGQRNVWYVGSDIKACRYLTKFMALVIKADEMGNRMDVYRKTPVLE
ncbi:FAD/NAD(P)-binding domain-containing protein [Saccharata proteae CBS 121410]|uniref:FAD/NAD(P)-binding domain-containing protein n=1 Tax=Saccharata proteae CBS 121410 TaxID=1314787 RepID=A0A9P4LZ72_9PEZI|nr:FAD/NAD(P)-binding domain-containing protein [Saccharata proteae CBS 121410]